MGTGTVDLCDLSNFEQGPPMAWFAELRAKQPVYWHEVKEGPGFWLVTKNQDVQSISRDWKTFSSDLARGGIMGLSEAERQMVCAASVDNSIPMMDPPEHTKYRKIVSRTTLPSMVADTEPFIRKRSHELLDNVVDKGPQDFVEGVAVWLPLEVLAHMANIPIRDRDQVFRWVNAVTTPGDPDYCQSPEMFLQSRHDLQSYCREIYHQRAATPGDDIVSVMITGDVEGEQITENQSVAFFELLLGAGSETTRTSLSQALRAFAAYPDQYAKLRAAPEQWIDTAVEEVLRWSTPIMYFRREATVDTEIRGVSISAGDSVVLSYLSANYDEEVFENPERFDISRPLNRHVAFGGGGPHNCLGANLARLEIKTFLQVLTERVAHVELAARPIHVQSNMMNSLKRLYVRLDS